MRLVGFFIPAAVAGLGGVFLWVGRRYARDERLHTSGSASPLDDVKMDRLLGMQARYSGYTLVCIGIVTVLWRVLT